MPRFAVMSESSYEWSSSSSSALPEATARQQSMVVSSRQQEPRGLLRSLGRYSLSCLSPDGRTMFSITLNTNDNDDDDDDNVCIEAHNLPLEGTTEQQEDEMERQFPAVIRIKLPPSVTSILRVDAPLELFCADGDHVPRQQRRPFHHHPEQQQQHDCPLPLLCLYTRHSVFLLELAFPWPFQDGNDNVNATTTTSSVVTGRVVSVAQPLEGHLDSEFSSSSRIVRVRPAPQQRMGYAAMCPPGSLAMLTHDANINDYALVLYHGSHQGRRKGWVSVPLRFGMEQLQEDNDESTVTDFCFAQSNGQALLATMSVLLLQASGNVLGASPILFDGTVVPRSTVRSAKEYLQYVIDRHDTDNNDDEARVRQCVAALQFFRDAFPPDDDDNNNNIGNTFVTARTSVGGVMESSLIWPVQIQGPVLVSSSSSSFVDGPDEEWRTARVIEPFFSQDLVGMAIAREDIAVDFAVVPATSLLPRFIYMGERDQYHIDGMLEDLGILVERVIVDSPDGGNDAAMDSDFIALVRDPIVESMIHYASSHGVVSITTNAMRIFSNEIRREAASEMSPVSSRKDETVRSMAWSSLDVSAGSQHITLAGAVVSGDALLGHTLVASLSNGSCAAINLTESRYLHESAPLFHVEDAVEDETSRVTKEALQAMESTPPFHEILVPLVNVVQEGLAGMGKIVGGRTAPEDIDPATLATVIAVKERCENEIIMPLQEMDQAASARLEQLKEMYKSQLQQVSALKEKLQLLQDRVKTTNETMQVAESNATLLAQRSGALLQACQDLRPSITNAETEYFALLKRLAAKCAKWEETVGTVLSDSSDLCAAIDAGHVRAAVELTPSDEQNCHALLRGEEASLKTTKESLDETRRVVNSVIAATGLGAGDENLSPADNIGQQ